MRLVFIAVEYELCDIFECLPLRAPNLEILQLDIITDVWIEKSSDIKFVQHLPKLKVLAVGSNEFGHSVSRIGELRALYKNY